MTKAQKRKYAKQLSDPIEEAYAGEPRQVHGKENVNTAFYTDNLIRILKSLFEVKCANDMWDKDYILTTLVYNGFIGVTDTSAGVLPLRCSLTGINVFELPTTAIFANPVLGSFNRVIDKDCIVITLNGLVRRNPIYFYANLYATKLADIDAAIEINLFNSRTTEIYAAADKREADSLKAMYDEMGYGKPAVFVESTILDNARNMWQRKVKENFVTDALQEARRRTIEEFLTAIGINNANTDKRERLITGEVNANNEEILVNTEYWNRNLEEGCEKANKMFPDIDLEITMPYRECSMKALVNATQQSNGSIIEQEGGEDDGRDG